MVAPLIDSLITGTPRTLPLNIPNDGSVVDLPLEVVVETMCVVDDRGVRGRDKASLPPGLAEQLKVISASQELTVQAALSGRRDLVIEAMHADPLTGRMDAPQIEALCDALLEATEAWLPQFA
jgi:alpha-galactosidase/6-phospho-beta-glucosidase family protein